MRVAAVVGDSLGEIVKVPTPHDPTQGISALISLARECAGGEEISALVGCIAADTIGADGVLSGARNLRAWEGTNIVRELSRGLGTPVQLFNDVALAGLGEASVGAGEGCASLAYITVSTGVGAAIIRDGAVVASGADTRMEVDGTDIEYLVSGTAVQKKFDVPPMEVTSGDELANLADTLARGLCTLVERWSPEMLVLGGSMILGVNPIPFARVQETLAGLLGNEAARPDSKMAELGDNGGLWGGLAVLTQRARQTL